MHPQARDTIIFFGVVIVMVAALLWLPTALAGAIFAAFVLISFGGGLAVWLTDDPDRRDQLITRFRSARQRMSQPEKALPSRLRPWLRWQHILEIALITAVALYATRDYLANDPTKTLGGHEAEWQANTAYVAHNSLRDYGYLPLWNPSLEHGHPLIDNPQSFLMNPFNTWPSLIFGGVRGMKLSVVLAALLVGWGGWWLARVLTLHAPARVLLAVMLIGKGNMLILYSRGYVQLASSQAYFPWIIAATLVLLREDSGPHIRRASVALALALALQFWGGSIWFSLPMLLCIAVLSLFYGRVHGRWNGRGVWRLMVVGMLTAGLAAVTLLPIWIQRDYLGDHPSDTRGGTPVDFGRLLQQFVDGSRALYEQDKAPGEAVHYFSHIAPLWFVILLFVLIPPIAPFLHRAGGWGRLWLAGVVLIVIHLAWGAGGNPVIIWLYEHVSFLGQWRFVGRALGVASFWVAVLVALRFDGLWRLVADSRWQSWTNAHPFGVWSVQALLLIGLGLLGLNASHRLIENWETWARPVSTQQWDDETTCITWLREQYPDEPLQVYRYRYESILAYVNTRVRHWPIEADYEPLPLPDTLSYERIIQTMPAYAVGWLEETRLKLRQEGYRVMPDSPLVSGLRTPCLWARRDAPPYAYAVGLGTLTGLSAPITASDVTPVEMTDYLPDRIRLRVQASPFDYQVVVVSETAYPGWRVRVNGDGVKLESVGGFAGVILPKSTDSYEIEFAYRPVWVYVGAVISLITALGCAVGLLYRKQQYHHNNDEDRNQVIDRVNEDWNP